MSDSSTVNLDSEDPASGSTEPLPGKPKRLRLFRIVAVVCIFCIAFAASYFLRPSEEDVDVDAEKQHDTETAVEHKEHSKPLELKPEFKESNTEQIARADALLRQGSFYPALAIYKAVLVESNKVSGLVLYRMALCQEGLGNWEKSLPLYRASTGDENSPVTRIPAQLALARILTRLNLPKESRQLLYPLVLAGDENKVSPTSLSQATSLLALSWARDLAHSDTHDDSLTKLVDPPILPLELELELNELQPTTSAKETTWTEALTYDPAVTVGEKIIQRVQFKSRPALELLETLAKCTDYELHISKQARQVIAGRTAALRIQYPNRYISDIFDWDFRKDWKKWAFSNQQHRSVNDLWLGLADYLDLGCQVDGKALHLFASFELDEKAKQTIQRRLARSALHAALDRNSINSPKSEIYNNTAAAAYLNLAQIELIEGKSNKALTWYETLLHEFPGSSLCVQASYNEGLIRYERGEYSSARESFSRVIDYAPAHQLTPKAYLLIGRTFLEAGDHQHAIQYFQRAHSYANGSDFFPYSTLHLAAAYLLDQSPQLAFDILKRDRLYVQSEAVRPTAQFLEALARFRLQRGSVVSRQDTAFLIDSVTRLRSETPLAMIGTLLRGSAYRELGMFEQGANTFDEAMPHLVGPLEQRIQYQQAEMLLHIDKRKPEALGLFKKVLEGHDHTWSSLSLYQLAKLDMEGMRFQECIERCKTLWADEHFTDRNPLLILWGSAYERVGDSEKASKCFAGIPPI